MANVRGTRIGTSIISDRRATFAGILRRLGSLDFQFKSLGILVDSLNRFLDLFEGQGTEIGGLVGQIRRLTVPRLGNQRLSRLVVSN